MSGFVRPAMIEIICLIALVAAMLGLNEATAHRLSVEGLSAPQHSIVKRMDLETCLVRFDVHVNTIIRTEESRSMGANFLDDADVSSREQCLRLCCETEKCDVFVFEEKNQGTCFLFECGPPTDFHCKFTHHSNYTSAVLKIPSVEQQPPPLVSQIHSLAQPPQMAMLPKLSQHELELVNLKVPKTPSRSEQPTTTALPPLGVQLGQLPTATTPKPTTATRCGHYEFPCHSGECIAIYNACDGIPQCADGSDEGPECPRPPPVKPFQPSPVQQQQQQQQMLPPQSISAGQVNEMPQAKPIIPQVFQPDLQQQQLRGLQEQQKLNRPMPHNREDPMTAPKAWPRPMSDPQTVYMDTPDSHIFNHKGGLQISSNNMAPPQYQATFPETSYIPNIPRNNPYMPSLSDGYPPQWTDPRMSPPQRPIWPQSQLPQEQYVQPPPQHQSDMNPSPIQPVPSNPQPSEPQSPPPQPQPAATPIAADTQSKAPVPVDEASKKPDNHKAGKSSEEYESYDEQYPEKSSKEDQEEEKPEPPQKKKPRKHHKQHQQHDEEHKKRKSKTAKKDKAVHDGDHMPAPVHLKMLRSDMEIEFVDHDGQADRPGGAVLSLTLGAILTAALAILIGCRMKVARRRVRRQGKGGYAHDADFLVNGMYL